MSPFREVTIPNGVTFDAGDIAPVNLMWLPIDKLRIDTRFQRPLGSANWVAIKRIAVNFQWARFAPVLVAPVEGGFYSVIDGQHRVHAALMCGRAEVPAQVANISLREQAAAFQWVNQQTIRVRPESLYKAAIVAGEPWAMDCQKAVADADCQLMTYAGNTASKKAGQIFAVELIKRLVVSGRGEAVTSGLRALRAYDKASRVPLYSTYILSPWLQAVAAAPQAAVDSLTDVLSRNDPFKVVEVAAKLRANGEATTAKDAFVVLIKREATQCNG